MKTLPVVIEVGCEEIPARMLPGAAAELGRVVTALLDRAGLEHDAPRGAWTPRRIAVTFERVQAATPEKKDLLLGPPARAAWDAEGRPTRAAEGFARKNGARVEDLVREKTERGEYAALEVRRPARRVGEVLADGFEESVARISFPKTMRWSDGRWTFVRPVHSLVALAGDQVMPLRLFGIEAGRRSLGHRALSPEGVEIGAAASWSRSLAEAGVEVDPRRRRERLLESLRAVAAEQGGELVEDEALLTEVADMVELPAALGGRFDRRFVDALPVEVLETCLRQHQKAFTIAKEGRRLPAFAVAVNMPADPQGHIRRGHEWVISGRLEDALFFWNEDRRRPLEDRRDALEGVIFHQKLGTYAAKVRRVQALSLHLAAASGFSAAQRDHLARAAALCRCDLVTGLVGEFPELQGRAGGLMARADGVAEDVVAAIYDHYLPASATDPLPRTREGLCLALADRLDTLAGGFAAGLAPTGSRDPFALRRAGTAAVRLAEALGPVDLAEALVEAFAGYRGGSWGPDLAGAVGRHRRAVLDFLLDRLAVLGERRGARYDEINAVTALGRERLVVADLVARLEALRRFRDSDDFYALAAAAKRVRNILSQAREKGQAVEAGAGAEALVQSAEVDLAGRLEQVRGRVEAAAAAADYRAALEALAGLRNAIDRFFDEIMVMDEDPSLRRARLGLLAGFHDLAHSVVQLSELVA
ncbi:MAG: glycine--tRNA ligase subunit beta [Acidobacteriota bacterium]|nr:glycine--tRNA ligase subunit beta [Acidobacteriota bacterium]